MDRRSLDSQAGYGEGRGMDKKELAQFLRHRREVLRPRDVGLVEGPRRRTQGLRREEVAQLAGMSTDYYARLEQQRAPQPSVQLGRPVVKAWNAALAETQRTRGVPAGTPGRLAIPVAGDTEEARRVAMQLVDDTGFDPYDAGTLVDSWRQQPNSPAYCG